MACQTENKENGRQSAIRFNQDGVNSVTVPIRCVISNLPQRGCSNNGSTYITCDTIIKD